MVVGVDGLQETLTQLLAEGRLLGVATSDNEQSCRIALERLDILDKFHFICGYDSGFGSKPGPGMVEVS